MEKKSKKNIGRGTERAALIVKTAEITGYSVRYVQYVLNGDRENEAVFSTYMTLLEELGRLTDAVKKAVPFN